MNMKQIIIPTILVIGMMLATIGTATAGPCYLTGDIYWSNGSKCLTLDGTVGNTLDITDNRTGQTWNQSTPLVVDVTTSPGSYQLILTDPTDIWVNDGLDYHTIATDASVPKTETNTTHSTYLASPGVISFDIHLVAGAVPDLVVDSIDLNPNCGLSGYLFANESNEICAVIKNIGSLNAPASSASFEINGVSMGTCPVSSLAPGGTDTVCITDTTLRNHDDPVTINVTADCDDDVAESASGELNNESSLGVTVTNNGYKGKYLTGGPNMTTWKTYDLNGSLIYSAGTSAYCSGSGGWTYCAATWDTGDGATHLNIPSSATLVEARLYVPYTYAADGAMPDNYTMEFNGNPETFDEHYWDTKWYDRTYPYYGMLVYNVTANFTMSGTNDANLTSLWHLLPAHSGASIRGMELVVIYEDANEPHRQIFVNEEFDILYGGSGKCTTPDEATAWAPFTGLSIDMVDLASARLITFAPGASPDEGELIVNGNVYQNEWNSNGPGAHQIGVSDRTVTSDLDPSGTGNIVGFQSSEDWMEASNAFLVLTLGVVNIGIDQPEFVDPQSQFTINITVDPKDNEISAVQYDLYYDTGVVWAEWANPGPFLKQGGASTDVTVLSIDNTFNTTHGKISYAETTLAPPGSGDLPSVNTTPGVLTTIHFSAIGERGTFSVMDIEDVMISDPNKDIVMYLITDCGVTIYDNIPPVAIATSKYHVSNVASKFQCSAALCCCNSHGGWENESEWKGNNITYVRWDFGDGQYGTSEGLEDCQKHHEYTSWNWNEVTKEYDPFIAYLTVRDDGEPQLSNTTQVEVMVYIAGDTNNDGVVDILDAACVGKHYGQSNSGEPDVPCGHYWTDPQADMADLNNDNRVTTNDLMIVGTNWNHLAYPPYIQD